jgi:hypothetical protein
LSNGDKDAPLSLRLSGYNRNLPVCHYRHFDFKVGGKVNQLARRETGGHIVQL